MPVARCTIIDTYATHKPPVSLRNKGVEPHPSVLRAVSHHGPSCDMVAELVGRSSGSTIQGKIV